MKPIVIGAIALIVVVGLAGASYVFIAGGDDYAATKAAPQTTAKSAAKVAPAAVQTDDGEMARLKQENALLKQQLDNVREQIAKKQQEDAVLVARQREEASKTTQEELDPKQFWDDAKEAAVGDDKKDKKDKKDRRGRGAAMEERSQQFAQAMDQFYDDALSQGGPPEVQDRLTALRDYSKQMMDLSQQARAATDPATKDALMQQRDDLRQEMKPLVKDQQEYMLRQAAENSGVTDTSTQNQLVNAVRETVKSPFFTMGGRGGGPGGPPRGGGAGGGQ